MQDRRRATSHSLRPATEFPSSCSWCIGRRPRRLTVGHRAAIWGALFGSFKVERIGRRISPEHDRARVWILRSSPSIAALGGGSCFPVKLLVAPGSPGVSVPPLPHADEGPSAKKAALTSTHRPNVMA